MAIFSKFGKILSQFVLNNNINKQYNKKCNNNMINLMKTSVAILTFGSIVIFVCKNYNIVNVVHAAKPRKRDDDAPRAVKFTMRERRFIKFASVDVHGQIYMTPRDFLDSVVESEPRPRHKRRVLTERELEIIKNTTPLLRNGGPHLFTTIKEKGIVSYTEYLFLLSILTKPQTGFRIAFNMFDTDGNERVDKNEFLVIRRLFSYGVKERKSQEALDAMENIFSHAWKGRHGVEQLEADKKISSGDLSTLEDYDQGLLRRDGIDTSLMIHFFGKDGKSELQYEGFRQFMENLQFEVLQLEFGEFSKGQNTITELDFAKILLRYTYLDTDEYDKYLERLLDRLQHQTNINFDEFQIFYQFLNSLDDFSIAMRMYTLANHPISKDEFMRAVKICTGTCISKHIIDTVFALFDVDGDGQLSYEEFIAIMKDRLHRGFKTQPRSEGWEAFKQCVKQEIKGP